MPRALLIVLDSFGCGGAPDAACFDDAGADTLGHIAAACARGAADRADLRRGPLRLPHLAALGLGEAARLSVGRRPDGFAEIVPRGTFGCASETSQGKDTPSGHWEIAGAPADAPFGYFPKPTHSFPRDLLAALVREGGLPGLLGDCHASGLSIIDELGEECVRTGKPICYTSVDSVFQIAAHEDAFGLDRLYDLCRIARRLCDPLRVGRVIARPFVGAAPADFKRTAHRKDFSIPPPPGNLFDVASKARRPTISLGKIGDIFDHRNTGQEIKGANNMEQFDALLRAWPNLPEGGLIFANFVDFDTDFGHRRDVAGYAACLEAFDARLAEIEPLLREGDLVVVTADHGNDPTFKGSDHTRENVPILCYGPTLASSNVGRRSTFADIGASVADWLRLPSTAEGTSFLR